MKDPGDAKSMVPPTKVCCKAVALGMMTGVAARTLVEKVMPMGEEMGLVEEGRGWQTGLGLHLKKV